jgi:hypothetical protein
MRRFSFGLVVVTALIVAACGRQVTPNPAGFGAGGAAPGFMSVKFDVAGTFNFSSYQYWLVFDPTGDGKTPSTYPARDGWNGYWNAIEVSGTQGATSASVWQFVRSPGNPIPYPQRLPPVSAQQLQYFSNSNGSGSEFTVVFARSLFFNRVNPSPSPSPLPLVWTYNAFTTQGSFPQQIFVDSMGAGGAVDPQYVSPALDTRTCFDQPFYSRYGGQLPDPNAQIASVEIANNPSPAPSISPCPTPH